MALVSLFWNAAERRLRAPFRLVLGLLLVGVVLAAGSAVLGLLAGAIPAGVLPPAAERLPRPLASTSATTQLLVLTTGGGLASVVGVYLAGRLFDRRRFVDFGFYLGRDWNRDLVFGIFLGALLQAGIVAVQYAAGWLRVEGVVLSAEVGVGLALALVAMVVVGLSEELLLRGYLLKNLLEGLTGPLSVVPAAALASLGTAGLFGVLHATNPNAGPTSVAVIAVAGVLFAVAYLLTGELGLPIGLHATWNFVQGAVFGLPVSGLDLGPSLVRTRVSGPALYTGGAFGPEAGVVGLGAVLVGILAVVGWTYLQYGDAGLAPDIELPDLRHR